MSRNRNRACSAAAAASAAVGLCIALSLSGADARADEALRPEIGRPLQSAGALIDKRRFSEALAKVKDAEAVGLRDANEKSTLERMRLSAALGVGDIELAAKSFEALQGTALVAPADALRMIEAIAGGWYRAKDYAKAQQWAQRYFKEGGSSTAMRTLLVQSRYLNGDFAGVVREVSAELQGAEPDGTALSEDRLQLLLDAAAKSGNDPAYELALRKLVARYPRTDYWAALLSRVRRAPGFASELSLDLFRLSLATGSLTTADDFIEMAELALQADLPAEAGQIVDKGFASRILGQGAKAERHERLRQLIVKRLQADEAARGEMLEQAESEPAGDALLLAGMKLVYAGQPAKGVQLMQKGVAKGHLRRPDEARLHLALARLAAGDRTGAVSTLKTVQGRTGAADLARLWAVHLRNGA